MASQEDIKHQQNLLEINRRNLALYLKQQQLMGGEAYITPVVANGIREARISDEWNDHEGWKFRVGVAHAVGMKVILNLIYSVSPKHSDEYFAERTRQAASLKPYRLCLKDPGGLLTPERMQTLVPIIFQNANGIPVELHTHCTTGLGPLCCLEGMKLGIRSINTALPPLADDSSNPSLFNVAKNARALGYATDIDEEVLKPVSQHFTAIAKREGFTVGAPVEYDFSQYQHQVPGGMLSNLRHQLRACQRQSCRVKTLRLQIAGNFFCKAGA